MADPTWYDDEDDDWVSKTQIKKEMHALQKSGERLLTLSKAQLKKIPLTEELIDAVDDARRIKTNEGIRRHLQYMGKLMRVANHEEIIHAMDLFDPSSDLFHQRMNEVETWRNRLLMNGEAHLKAFLELHPDVDRQNLLQLVRNAKKEVEKDTPSKKNYKNLFKLLKTLILPDVPQ